MQPVVDFNDEHAWDDSFLVNSWDEALAEYNKYHSIAKSGKRLEDVLTEEELRELREDHGNLIGEPAAETTPGGIEPQESLDATERESPRDKMDGVTEAQHVAQQAAQPQEAEEAGPAQDRTAEHVAAQSAPLAGALPQALLGTVQDANLKNLMASLYYTGYYQGVYDAGQKIPGNMAPEQ